MMDTQELRRCYLHPSSIAFVGVPRKSGPGSLNPVDNLRKWGYEGTIHLVHPFVDEIAGLRTFTKVSEIKNPVELAVLSTPRETIPGIVAECGHKGIKALIVTVQGFAEADSKGRVLQRNMIAEAHKYGIRILGPNTLGVSNAFDRFNTSFMPLDREELPIGLICQSGVFFVGAAPLLGGMGIGVDIGNACDLGLVEALEWLGDDERLKCIAFHAEELSGGDHLLEVAKRISARIPIVAIKTGRSPEGAKAAASHTGSMAGEDKLSDAALRKAGILRVAETQDMYDLVRAFTRMPPMKGRRVAIVTLTGAGGIILLDAMYTNGLELASLSAHTLQSVQKLSPDWMPISNPMDIWPAVMKNGMKKAYDTSLRNALKDPKVDGVLCFALALKPEEQVLLGAEEVIRELSVEFDKPIVVWLYGHYIPEARERLLMESRALTVDSLERGVRVLAGMAQYENQRRKTESS